MTVPSAPATAVPTSTGTTAAGRVRGLAPAIQSRAVVTLRAAPPSRAAREPCEIGGAFFDIGVAALLALFGHVEKHRRVALELLDAGEAVVGGVEPGLQHAKGDRREGKDLT